MPRADPRFISLGRRRDAAPSGAGTSRDGAVPSRSPHHVLPDPAQGLGSAGRAPEKPPRHNCRSRWDLQIGRCPTPTPDGCRTARRRQGRTSSLRSGRSTLTPPARRALWLRGRPAKAVRRPAGRVEHWTGTVMILEQESWSTSRWDRTYRSTYRFAHRSCDSGRVGRYRVTPSAPSVPGIGMDARRPPSVEATEPAVLTPELAKALVAVLRRLDDERDDPRDRQRCQHPGVAS